MTDPISRHAHNLAARIFSDRRLANVPAPIIETVADLVLSAFVEQLGTGAEGEGVRLSVDDIVAGTFVGCESCDHLVPDDRVYRDDDAAICHQCAKHADPTQTLSGRAITFAYDDRMRPGVVIAVDRVGLEALLAAPDDEPFVSYEFRDDVEVGRFIDSVFSAWSRVNPSIRIGRPDAEETSP